MIEVKKYRQTRFWAVYVDGELLAVVVYRKGAMAIADLILTTGTGKRAFQAAGHQPRLTQVSPPLRSLIV